MIRSINTKIRRGARQVYRVDLRNRNAEEREQSVMFWDMRVLMKWIVRNIKPDQEADIYVAHLDKTLWGATIGEVAISGLWEWVVTYSDAGQDIYTLNVKSDLSCDLHFTPKEFYINLTSSAKK